MQQPAWVKVLTILASWLLIIGLIVLLYEILKHRNNLYVIPTATAQSTTFNSSSKGDTPLAESIATNTVGYWLELQSSTNNAYALPSYLTGTPRIKIVPDLISCESSGIVTALNPKDRDGTASIGIVQFKPLTLWSEAIHYGLIPSSTPKSVFVKPGNPQLETIAQRNRDIRYNAQLQIDVMSYMIMDNWQSPAFWLQQFPQCFRNNRSDWGV